MTVDMDQEASDTFQTHLSVKIHRWFNNNINAQAPSAMHLDRVMSQVSKKTQLFAPFLTEIIIKVQHIKLTKIVNSMKSHLKNEGVSFLN